MKIVSFGPMLCVVACAAVAAGPAVVAASDLDELKVKRQGPFEFATKPTVTRNGDRVTIAFETTAFCDVTVAIEEARVKVPGTPGFQEPWEQPRIIRHLASGVLGPNAPEPFQRNSRKQTLVWDGKNDKGEYIENLDAVTVRVSLGLKPRFERTLYWSPHKKLGGWLPLIAAAPEGVYVLDGVGDGAQLRLFDHQGDYVRTVYPFPADQIEKVKRLTWGTYPPDDLRVPLRDRWVKSSFLKDHGRLQALAVQGGRAYLATTVVARLATGGDYTGSDLDIGQVVLLTGGRRGALTGLGGRIPYDATPWSIAPSPDGKYLYATGYKCGVLHSYYAGDSWLGGVLRVSLGDGGDSQPFLGVMKSDRAGERKDNTGFNVPIAVACDPTGRIYVADHMNDRVQVFSPEGEHLKTIRVTRPAEIRIDPKTGEIWVFSWGVCHYTTSFASSGGEVKAKLTRLGPFDDPTPRGAWPLPVIAKSRRRIANAAIDFWTDPPTLWLVRDPGGYSVDWQRDEGIKLYRIEDRTLALARSFQKDAQKAVARTRPPGHSRWRLHVNPKNGKLYVAEDHFPAAIVVKGSSDLIEVDPESGRVRIVALPFDCEDLAFDLDGRAYLRTLDMIARYDGETWREVPFDYGTDTKISYQGLKGGKAVSAILFPGGGNASSQMGGMWVSPKGHIVVTTCNPVRWSGADERKRTRSVAPGVRKYRPRLFPGRADVGLIHVFDPYGRVLYHDAVPGVGFTEGVAMDNDDNLYLMAVSPGRIDGKPYPDPASCTIVKLAPRTKVLTDRARIGLSDQTRPERPVDLLAWRDTGNAWIEGAHWTFTGVGLDTQNMFAGSGKCHCTGNSRFALDLFGRSIAPELPRCDVAVIDSAGNLIMRFGRYGNVDDGLPLVVDGGSAGKGTGDPDVKVPGPFSGVPRSIGGDEVALFNPRFAATHTDHRIFLGDRGNERILSVKLNYSATERVALKDVKDNE